MNLLSVDNWPISPDKNKSHCKLIHPEYLSSESDFWSLVKFEILSL